MLTRGGVKNLKNLADVIFERPQHNEGEADAGMHGNLDARLRRRCRGITRINPSQLLSL